MTCPTCGTPLEELFRIRRELTLARAEITRLKVALDKAIDDAAWLRQLTTSDKEK